MSDEKFKITGILKGIDTNSGTGTNGKWTRMAIKIEKEKKIVTLSTFDEADQAELLKANGKMIEVQYTKSIKEEKEYKNIIKGTIKILGEGSSDQGTVMGDVKEETVDDGVKEESVKDEPTATVQNTNPAEKKDYWQKKFDYELERDPIVQQRIVRQNAWTQANNYINNLLKAVELKVEGVKLESNDLTIKSMEALTHQIEKDIMRK